MCARKYLLVNIVFVFLILLISGCDRGRELKSSVVFLSDIEPIQKKGNILEDINLEEHKLVIGNKSNRDLYYEKGLCVDSSNFKAVYNLNGQFKIFKAVIGHHIDYPEYDGKVKFFVFKDLQKIYESDWLGYGDIEYLFLSVEDADRMIIEVKDNDVSSAYVLWADAKLIKKE